MEKYGVVPTEYYPNSSYGSMSTEALVTLLNQVLRDDVIILRNTGDKRLIKDMMSNVFSILCMGLGTPPMPWKKLDWQLDQCETVAHYSAVIAPPKEEVVQDSVLPPETTVWLPIAAKKSKDLSPITTALLDSLDQDVASRPPSPVESTATARYKDDEDLESSLQRPENVESLQPSKPDLQGILPPQKVVNIGSDKIVKGCSLGKCKDRDLVQSIQDFFKRPCEKSAPSTSNMGPVEDDVSRRVLGSRRPMAKPPMPCGAVQMSHVISGQVNVEDALSFDYTPSEFYKRFLTSVSFIPVICDPRFATGTRIISNDANMVGGKPSLYLNLTVDDLIHYAIASIKRNIPVWFACDVKKQLTPEGGRMCTHDDRLSTLLPRPHKKGTKLEEINHFNSLANHALVISAVSMKGGKPSSWRIVNSWGDVGRNAGVFVACNDWFREHVYSINAVYDTLSAKHKEYANLNKSRPTVQLGPFDPSVI